jgi:hypothetical protein
MTAAISMLLLLSARFLERCPSNDVPRTMSLERRGSNHGGTTLTLAEHMFGVKRKDERVFATNA